MKTEEMNNIPKIIYLQIPTEYESEPFEDIAKIQHVTWCPDKINENDIEYKLSFDVAELEDELMLKEQGYETLVDIADEIKKERDSLRQLNKEMLEVLKSAYVEDIAKIQHVTWCPDKINENDIEYKLSFDVAELEQEHELLKKTLEKQHEITDDLFDKIIKLSKLNDEMLEALKAGSFYIANGELLNKVKSIIEKAEKVME